MNRLRDAYDAFVGAVPSTADAEAPLNLMLSCPDCGADRQSRVDACPRTRCDAPTRRRGSVRKESLHTAEPLTARVQKLMAATASLVQYGEWTIGSESPGHHPTMPSAVYAARDALSAFPPFVAPLSSHTSACWTDPTADIAALCAWRDTYVTGSVPYNGISAVIRALGGDVG